MDSEGGLVAEHLECPDRDVCRAVLGVVRDCLDCGSHPVVALPESGDSLALQYRRRRDPLGTDPLTDRDVAALAVEQERVDVSRRLTGERVTDPDEVEPGRREPGPDKQTSRRPFGVGSGGAGDRVPRLAVDEQYLTPVAHHRSHRPAHLSAPAR